MNYAIYVYIINTPYYDKRGKIISILSQSKSIVIMFKAKFTDPFHQDCYQTQTGVKTASNNIYDESVY